VPNTARTSDQARMDPSAYFTGSTRSVIVDGHMCEFTVFLEAVKYYRYTILFFSIVVSVISLLESFGASAFALINITNTQVPNFFTVCVVFFILLAHAYNFFFLASPTW
jgi:hypothetical protein